MQCPHWNSTMFQAPSRSSMLHITNAKTGKQLCPNVSIENSNYFQKATNTELLFQGSIVRVQLRMSRVSGIKNIQKYQSCGWSAVHLLLAIAPFIVGRPSMPFHCISQTTIFTKDTHATWRWEGRPFQNLPIQQSDVRLRPLNTSEFQAGSSSDGKSTVLQNSK